MTPAERAEARRLAEQALPRALTHNGGDMTTARLCQAVLALTAPPPPDDEERDPVNGQLVSARAGHCGTVKRSHLSRSDIDTIRRVGRDEVSRASSVGLAELDALCDMALLALAAPIEAHVAVGPEAVDEVLAWKEPGEALREVASIGPDAPIRKIGEHYEAWSNMHPSYRARWDDAAGRFVRPYLERIATLESTLALADHLRHQAEISEQTAHDVMGQEKDRADKAETERDEALAMVRKLFAAAVPNERDHPTMWKVWREAEAFLSGKVGG